MAKKLSLMLALAALVALGCGGSQKQAEGKAAGGAAVAGTEGAAASEVLPVDPRIRHGVLENGLTYYVLEHQKPEERAQLWLAVNAGAINEDDDQQGLAHFVEHMAFNGTEKFEEMAIVDYLESIGMKFGPDVNAYTSFDETVYMLQVPTDDQAIVDKGLEILHQWAHAIAFDPEEVEKERGVVLEEWRLGRGAWKRILDKQYPVIFHDSRYAKRLPIGKADIIKGAPREALTRFYRDWYRPDLMAIVAVGDFDGAAMESRIKERFGDLEGPDQPRAREAAPVPSHSETLVTIETDPEMPQTRLVVYNKMPHRQERTKADYRRFVVESLYNGMLNQRLDEIRRSPDAPFMFAFSNTSDLVRTADGFVRTAFVKQGRVEEALETIVTEIERVERHGFTATEFERAKKELLRNYQKSVKERDKSNGRKYASEIVRNFLTGEMMPGIEYELGLVEEFLPEITIEELNELAGSWRGKANRVVTVSGPEKAKMPTEESLLAVISAVEESEIAAYEDEVTDKPLLADKPEPGKVTDTSEIEELGVTIWKLENGIEVYLKPTDFKNDEVRFRSFSPGGHSLVADADYPSARFAASIVSGGGVGEFSAVALRKALSGKVVSVRAYLNELEEGFSGSASPQDLETMFQLLYLRATAPRKDPEAFGSWKAGQVEWVRNRKLSPQSAFFDEMVAFMAKGHPRRQPPSLEFLDKVDHDKALEIYRDRFADLSDAKFVFVGNIDLEKLKPLVETYVGSLPATERKEKWKDVGVKHPRGVKKKTVRRGVEPKSFVYLQFHGRQKWTRDGQHDIEMLSEALRIRLREVLREDLGGVYFVSANGAIARRPKEERRFTIFFSCDPGRVDELVKAVFSVIDEFKKKGVEEKYVTKVREGWTRNHELDLKRNGYWTRELKRALVYGDDPRQILKFDAKVEKVSSKRIKRAARKYLRKGYVLGVLRPEKGAEEKKGEGKGKGKGKG